MLPSISNKKIELVASANTTVSPDPPPKKNPPTKFTDTSQFMAKAGNKLPTNPFMKQNYHIKKRTNFMNETMDPQRTHSNMSQSEELPVDKNLLKQEKLERKKIMKSLIYIPPSILSDSNNESNFYSFKQLRKSTDYQNAANKIMQNFTGERKIERTMSLNKIAKIEYNKHNDIKLDESKTKLKNYLNSINKTKFGSYIPKQYQVSNLTSLFGKKKSGPQIVQATIEVEEEKTKATRKKELTEDDR